MTRLYVDMEAGAGQLEDAGWQALAEEAGEVFHHGEFLLAWWRQASHRDPELRLSTAAVFDVDGTRVGQCAFEMRGETLRFAGGSDVVDYMGPVSVQGRESEVAAALVDLIFDELSWNRADLSGLAAGPMAMAFVAAVQARDQSREVAVHDASPRMEAAPQRYLERFNSKRRADIVRKRRRLTEVVGETRVAVAGATEWPKALDRLLSWKAVAMPDSRAFIEEFTDFLHAMLGALGPVGKARIVELCAGQQILASAIVLDHRSTRYLYNMSYDLQFADSFPTALAPGVVLVSHLAEEAVESGKRFDFLKGRQDYKIRLGGTPEDILTIGLRR